MRHVFGKQEDAWMIAADRRIKGVGILGQIIFCNRGTGGFGRRKSSSLV